MDEPNWYLDPFTVLQNVKADPALMSAQIELRRRIKLERERLVVPLLRRRIVQFRIIGTGPLIMFSHARFL